MNLLLDTHVWIWSQECPQRLGAHAREILSAADSKLYVSTISTLELARLIHGGLVEIAHPLERWISQSLELLRCDTLELSHKIAMEAYALPEPFHKDPADRLIVASARLHKLRLITADERLLAYPHVHGVDARR